MALVTPKKRKKKKKLSASQKKVAKVFHEWGQGKLHSGSKHGPLVDYPGKQKQAIAIALSEGRKAAKSGRHKQKQDSSLDLVSLRHRIPNTLPVAQQEAIAQVLRGDRKAHPKHAKRHKTRHKPGYVWVTNPKVKNGGFWRKLRKNQAHASSGPKDIPKQRKPRARKSGIGAALAASGVAAIGGSALFTVLTVRHQVRKAKAAADEKVLKARQQFEQQLGEEKQKAITSATKQIEEAKQQTAAHLERESTHNQARLAEKEAQLQKQFAEKEQAIQTEAQRKVAKAQETASFEYAQQLKAATDPKGRQRGTLINDPDRGISIGASVRNPNGGLDLEATSQAKMTDRVKNGVKSLIDRRTAEAIETASNEFRQKIESIVDGPATTAVKWEAVETAMRQQVRRENAIGEDLTAARKKYQEKYLDLTDQFYKKSRETGGFSDDLIDWFDKKSKNINRRMQAEMSRQVRSVMRSSEFDLDGPKDAEGTVIAK